ncbi:MAG TPA: hypothetical protein VGR48_12275 [Terriglobales bacterium]|nr:hypothetical protein [Terriglobales bacterium]
MQRNWLLTARGTWFVAIGIVAISCGAALIIIQDVGFLMSGAWPKLWLYDEVLIYVSASVAALFCIASFSILRSGLAKFVTVVVAVSFASYVVQPFTPIHGHEQLTAISISRVIGLCTLLLLVLRYSRPERSKIDE